MRLPRSSGRRAAGPPSRSRGHLRRYGFQPPCADFGHFSPGVPDSLHIAHCHAQLRPAAMSGPAGWVSDRRRADSAYRCRPSV
jgi:hypothetical protein